MVEIDYYNIIIDPNQGNRSSFELEMEILKIKWAIYCIGLKSRDMKSGDRTVIIRELDVSEIVEWLWWYDEQWFQRQMKWSSGDDLISFHVSGLDQSGCDLSWWVVIQWRFGCYKWRLNRWYSGYSGLTSVYHIELRLGMMMIVFMTSVIYHQFWISIIKIQ